MTKAEVRERARQLGLANADKPESQEICFVPDGDYARFVERASAPERLRPGRIVDLKGRTLAAHAGVHRFTVGQRRGLGLSAPAPLYVREIRAQRGEVVVGPREGLAAVGLVARDLSFVDPESVASGAIAVEARIRYRHPALPARLAIESGGRARVTFASGGGPAVTPGQACVFYRGDEVVGGGFIERAL